MDKPHLGIQVLLLPIIGYGIGQRSVLIGPGWVNRHSRILVDDEQVIIFVNNVYRYVLGLHVCFFVIKDNLNQRSEEHTSELQSRPHLVCRLLLEKKKKEKQVNG